MTTKLPNNLKHLRIKNSYSQDDIAQKLFVSHQTISNHETGKSQPTLEIIQKYADFYQVDFHDLINTDLSKDKKPSKVIFDSVIFDKKDKTMIIIDGTKGTYSYKDIKKCSVLNEQSNFRGKTPPFTHQVFGRSGIYAPAGLIGTFTAADLFEPKLYVGLKLTMKDGSILAIYTSKKEIMYNSVQYQDDRKEAETIKVFIDKVIKKYQK